MNMVRDQGEVWPQPAPPGMFDLTQGGVVGYPDAVGHLIYICPNGKFCGVMIGPRAVAAPDASRQSIWAWDGNVEAPTLTPSINCVGGCGWHGFITAGVMR